MTLRDYFAAHAPMDEQFWKDMRDSTPILERAELVALWQFAYADAMLKQRLK